MLCRKARKGSQADARQTLECVLCFTSITLFRHHRHHHHHSPQTRTDFDLHNTLNELYEYTQAMAGRTATKRARADKENHAPFSLHSDGEEDSFDTAPAKTSAASVRRVEEMERGEFDEWVERKLARGAGKREKALEDRMQRVCFISAPPPPRRKASMLIKPIDSWHRRKTRSRLS